MPILKTEAIVIKRKNFGEADKIITVFTKNKGKIQIIAKGIRKINSKRSPHVELLNLSLIAYHDGKLPVLTEASSLKHYEGLKDNLQKAGHAFYICELVDGLIPLHQENRAVYNLLLQTLFELEKTSDPKPLIRKFEQEILILLGFWAKERMFLEEPVEFIEGLMERKIKSKKIFSHFS